MTDIKTITLKRGKAQPFWHKEALVFSGAIAQTPENLAAAEWVSVCDHQGKTIGQGFYNPHSLYRVRLVIFFNEPTVASVPDLIRYRLKQAIAKRHALDLPSEDTTAYRLLNSEGDHLSGLTIDIFDRVAVVASTAYWTEYHRALITDCVIAETGCASVQWRSIATALKQEGFALSAETPVKSSDYVRIKEHGVLYDVDVGAGQKTGFYCDQRDHRFYIRDYAKGRRVLDCYCYTGGFALNAAIAGAKSVVGIDSSLAAIELANKNAALNQCTQVVFERAKVEAYLAEKREVDFIILDPPKLSPREEYISRAKHYYLKLNQLALAQLEKGGRLLTCSCSQAMTAELFLKVVKKAAHDLNKPIRIIHVSGAASDHPFASKAKYGDYLKAIFLELL